MRGRAFHLFDMLVPAVAVAAWCGLLAGASDLEQQRGLVFAGGPLVLLAGLHARITAYLHDPDRIRTLPLPLSPRAHWIPAGRRHLAGLLVTGALGAAGLTVVSGPTVLPDWLALVLAALVVEPLIPAVSSDLGRRLPEGSPGAELQRSLGGGLTLPEATVHLWAPALGIGLAAAVAMPTQLTLARMVDGARVSDGLLGVSAAPWVVAAALRWRAPRRYAAGLWEAVPWLHETTRTLAGPPRPEATPRWIAAIRNPAARLWLLQLGRRTPLPTVRLLLLLGGSAVVTARGPGTWGVAIVAALAALWVLPAWRIMNDPARTRFLAPLPSGGPGLLPGALVLLPALAAVGVPLARQVFA